MFTLPVGFMASSAPTGDPYWPQVTMLLNANDPAHPYRCAKTGTDWAAGEGLTVDTTTPLSGGGSYVFPGYLKSTISLISSTTNDFTYEMRLKPTSLGSYLFGYNDNSGYAFLFLLQSDGTVAFASFISGSSQANEHTVVGKLTVGSVGHLALVRHGSELAIYVDGVKEVIKTGISSLAGSASRNWYFGRDPNYADGSAGYFNGLMDEMRLTDTVARYTSNYTPSPLPFLTS